MAAGSYTPQQRGRLGGLTRAATAASRQDITRAANAGRWQKYVDQVKAAVPGLTDDAEITRRAELLMKADMCRLSAKAAEARRLRAAGRKRAGAARGSADRPLTSG
jgi:hypothetical protein